MMENENARRVVGYDGMNEEVKASAADLEDIVKRHFRKDFTEGRGQADWIAKKVCDAYAGALTLLAF